MKLSWERKEFSVGVYTYIIVDNATGERVCHVWERTLRAKEFVNELCRRPEMFADVQARLSPGREARDDAIKILLG